MSSYGKIKEEDVIKAQKGVYILGKDIREIPCLRSSILLGITCGTFAGLVSFMVTSKVAMSSHIGFGSLWAVVFAYWVPCRYKYETNKAIRLHKTADIIYNKPAEASDTPVVEPEEEKKE